MPGMSLTTIGMALGMFGGAGAVSTLLNELAWYYKLDEQRGDREATAGGVSLSESSSTGESVHYAAGVQGYAALFDGSAFLGATNALFQAGNGGFTVAAWVYPTQLGADRAVLSKYPSTFEYALDYRNSETAFRFYATDSKGSLVIVTSSHTSVAIDTWYLVVAGYDPDTGQLCIQVNNGVVDTIAFDGPIKNDSAVFQLGIRGSNNPYHGRIDGVAGWKRWLTDEERAELWNDGDGLEYPFQTSIGPVTPPVYIPDGIWTWYNDPRGIRVGDKTFIGSLKDGDVAVSTYDHASEALTHTIIDDDFSNDDHANPSLLRRDSDNKLMLFYAGHGGAHHDRHQPSGRRGATTTSAAAKE